MHTFGTQTLADVTDKRLILRKFEVRISNSEFLQKCVLMQ